MFVSTWSPPLSSMGVLIVLRVCLLISAVRSLVISSPYRMIVSHVAADFSAEINSTGTVCNTNHSLGVVGVVSVAEPLSSCGNSSNPIFSRIVVVEKPVEGSPCSFIELAYGVRYSIDG